MSVLPFPSSQALCTLRATFCCCNILATQITNIWYAPLSPNPQSSTISRNEIDNCLTISRVQQPKAAKKCYVSFLVRSLAFCPFIGCFLYYNKMWTHVEKYKYNVSKSPAVPRPFARCVATPLCSARLICLPARPFHPQLVYLFVALFRVFVFVVGSFVFVTLFGVFYLSLSPYLVYLCLYL